jgi:hypothetical protein
MGIDLRGEMTSDMNRGTPEGFLVSYALQP